MLRALLVCVLLLSTIASCLFAGFFLVFIEAGLLKQQEKPGIRMIRWLCFPLGIAVYLSIPAASVVVFTSDPTRHTIALGLLSLLPVVMPLITLLTILRAGWEEIAGHPAAYGGHPPGRLATVGSLVLMEGLYLLPPLSAWLLSSLD